MRHQSSLKNGRRGRGFVIVDATPGKPGEPNGISGIDRIRRVGTNAPIESRNRQHAAKGPPTISKQIGTKELGRRPRIHKGAELKLFDGKSSFFISRHIQKKGLEGGTI